MTNIQTHYGGSVLAIKGSSTLVLLTDLRFGQGNITISCNFPKIHRLKNLFIMLPEFIPDAQTLLEKIRKNHNLFVLSEKRNMEPIELAKMVSFMLYQKRDSPYYTSPIVAGFDSEGKPYICKMDCLGCCEDTENFAFAGTAENNLAGFCEAIYDDSENEDLFVMGAQAFLNSVDRSALSGWGCEGYLVTKDKVSKRRLRSRPD
ncbi:proteasome core particle subunit beta 3 [Gurleya vavrai]